MQLLQNSAEPTLRAPQSPAPQSAASRLATSPVAHLARHHRRAFQRLRAGLRAELHPEGPLEEATFERLAVASWHLDLVYAYESSLLAGDANPFSPDRPPDEELADVQRHRRGLERSHLRALNALRRLQTNRAVLLQRDAGVIEKIHLRAPLAELPSMGEDNGRSVEGRAAFDHFLPSREAASRGAHDLRRYQATAEDHHRAALLAGLEVSTRKQ